MNVNLMEIERFAVHDGPGIRTVVFLQGCPLRCPWCSNPESQILAPILMHNQKKCVLCRRCESVCPQRAVYFDGEKMIFDRKNCTLCGRCAAGCPQDAISYAGLPRDTEEIVGEVLRDRDYYLDSGGGVTFSGGEPFVQYEGLLQMLRRCKEEGVSTAVETTGIILPEHLRTAEPFIDIFLFDLKHTDAKKLLEATGAKLETVLGSLRYLARHAPGKTVLRVPVIPGFNLEDGMLDEVFQLALVHGVHEVDLLPYHTLGKNKYAQIGKPYQMPELPMLPKQALEPHQKRGEALGLKVVIGG